jgi:uncharacterized protein (DUF362 family)
MSEHDRVRDEHRCPMEEEEEHFLNRRGFLGVGSALAGALAATGLWKRKAEAREEPLVLARAEVEPPQRPAGFEPAKMPGKIVQVTHPKAMASMRTLNTPVVEKMVNQALLDLTGASSPAEAMSRFIHKDDIVGIHPNCLGSPKMGANPAVTFTLVKALLEMGVPEKSIIIYDQYGGRMRAVGYKLKDSKDGIKVLAHGMWGYEKVPTMTLHGRPVRFCNILKRVTAVVNVPVPKDHDLAGITGALKNMAFGNIQRVPMFHKDAKGSYLGISKNIADIYNHPLIREKVRLHVVDALRCLYQGGPQDRGPHKGIYNSILATTDPVAADVAILEIVNELRKAKKMKPIEEVRVPKRRPPNAMAEAAKLGLGVAERDKLQWGKKTLEG